MVLERRLLQELHSKLFFLRLLRRLLPWELSHCTDRCGKLGGRDIPDFPQAGDGLAPWSLLVDPDSHPPDEALGPLGGSVERGVDEISSGPDDAGGHGGNGCHPGSAWLLFLFQLVAQAFVLADVLLEEQQEVVGQTLEDRVTLLGREGTRPGFAFDHLAFELVEDFLDVPAVLVEQDDLIGGQGVVAGEIGVGHSIRGIGVNDAPQQHSARCAHQVV